MSNPIANYTFLPWVRQGIANEISSADFDGGVKLRAAVEISFDVDTDLVAGGTKTEVFKKTITLFGPGDIVGVDPKSIVKTDPKNWITNFEPNYIPYIEFYDEDFPWRYTPAKVNTDKLRPWITLVVIKEGAFAEAKNIQGKPLGYITVTNAAAIFPDPQDLWAYAHVHVSKGFTNDIKLNDDTANSAALSAALGQNADLGCSRLICPVKLAPNSAYHAFVLPTFETGRLAGLGLEESLNDAPSATHSAWAAYPNKKEPNNYPVYHRWYFRTGEDGDFEKLVKKLKPQPIDHRVGQRDIDVLHPGTNINPIDDAALDGVIKLGGALKVPLAFMDTTQQANYKKYDEWDKKNTPGNYPVPFQKDVANFINLADDYLAKDSDTANTANGFKSLMEDNADPLITAPLYGRWHAQVDRLLEKRDGTPVSNNSNWVHEINLDPRWRVAANFGTRVIQKNEEQYMEASWKQVGEVLEGNKKLKFFMFGKMASLSWFNRHVTATQQIDIQKALWLTAPVQKKVIHKQFTAYYNIKNSIISTSLVSPTLRKLIRPNGRIVRQSNFDGIVKAGNLIERINNGAVQVAIPKTTPESLPTIDKIITGIQQTVTPGWVKFIVNKLPWLFWALTILGVILLVILLLAAPPVAVASFIVMLLVGIAWLLWQLYNYKKLQTISNLFLEENLTPENVDQLPQLPNFQMDPTDPNYSPGNGGTDNEAAKRFKDALKDLYGILVEETDISKQPEKIKIDLVEFVKDVIATIHPNKAVPKLIANEINIPLRITAELAEDFGEVMVYPKIDTPMYEPLKSKPDNFLPNIKYISENSISLMETNQRFIESYMLGINHEFSRELLWREYPTDQRGSYFRQFWDVKTVMNTEKLSPATFKEKLKDIPELHRWSRNSKLGEHDNRQQPGSTPKEELVLVIRGELLKRYPTAVIYAQKAVWETAVDGTKTLTKERKLITLTAAELMDIPPPDKLKNPLYQAKVDPDITFIGFDLTAEEAMGRKGNEPLTDDNAGWFFIIKERPGEPRFGLDAKDTAGQPLVWSDLGWVDVLQANNLPGKYLPLNGNHKLDPLNASENDKAEQKVEDDEVAWDANKNAADIAYVLYQLPVLVAVHSGEMIPKKITI